MKILRNLCLFISILAFMGLCVDAKASHAATFYVATTGSDSNAGTAAAPFRTVQRGVRVLQSGDTLLIGAGTYAEGDLAPPSGTTLKAAPGARPVLRPNSRSIDTIILFAAGRSHITIDGLVLDGGSASDRVTLFPVATEQKTGNSHLKVLNSEIKHGRGSCFLVGGAHWEIRGNHIHHCGADTTYDHGLYFYGDDAVIAHNRFDHNACYNIQNYPSGSRNTYDSNVFTASGCGVTLTYGSDHRFVNNLLYDDASQLTRGEHGLLGFGSNTVVEGNILVNNGMVTINDGNDHGALIRGNTLCNGRIQAVHAAVQDNRMTCEGIDVEAEARKRTSATGGPTTGPHPAPRNLRVVITP